jgi:hypothetical protein
MFRDGTEKGQIVICGETVLQAKALDFGAKW